MRGRIYRRMMTFARKVDFRYHCLCIDTALHPNDAGYQRMADELLKAFATVK